MRFDPALTTGTLIRRYKRFLADVVLDSGEELTVHCPNSGSMLEVAVPDRPIALSHSDNPKRKYAYTWELIHLPETWVGVHTGRSNSIVSEAISAGKVPELAGYPNLRREVPYLNSRIDIYLQDQQRPDCYVEVKNVTLTQGQRAIFPDSVTTRGQKHLRELSQMVAQGKRAVMLFLINREDCREFGPADHLDPVYGQLLRQASEEGVEILAYEAQVNPKQVTLHGSIPILL